MVNKDHHYIILSSLKNMLELSDSQLEDVSYSILEIIGSSKTTRLEIVLGSDSAEIEDAIRVHLALG